MREYIESFKYGSYLYAYYSFMDKFHVEPKDWKDFLEHMEYIRVENDIADYIKKTASDK